MIAFNPLARAGTPEFDALEVGTQILAGGRGSRLYQRLVRTEDGIAGWSEFGESWARSSRRPIPVVVTYIESQ